MRASRPVEDPPKRLAGKVRLSKRAPPKKSFGEQIFKYIERGRKLLLGELSEGEGAPDLVGAWAWFHRQIYGIEPVELHVEWEAACGAAKRVFVEYLGGDFDEALDFVRWYAERAQNDKRQDSRMKWAFVFRATAVTDWKVARSRG